MVRCSTVNVRTCVRHPEWAETHDGLLPGLAVAPRHGIGQCRKARKNHAARLRWLARDLLRAHLDNLSVTDRRLGGHLGRLELRRVGWCHRDGDRRRGWRRWRRKGLLTLVVQAQASVGCAVQPATGLDQRGKGGNGRATLLVGLRVGRRRRSGHARRAVHLWDVLAGGLGRLAPGRAGELGILGRVAVVDAGGGKCRRQLVHRDDTRG